ncbi:MAG: hypothetical protein FVQ79_02110 [Planctomycetes bacterium]|nr:hypothetical protein [Planctomycetota bacterium]
MDSEHRHELKTNELAQWLSNLPGFLKENGKNILGILLIAAAVFSYFYFKAKKTSTVNMEQAQNTALIQQVSRNKAEAIDLDPETALLENAFATSASKLQRAADAIEEGDYAAALMLIKKGESLRAELHYNTSQLDEQVITDQIKEASQAYEQALQKAKGNASLTAMATFGLGLCAEEIGDFEKAVQIYSDIAQNTEFEGTLFPAQAQFRLDILEDNKETFVFVVVPKIELPAGIDPALKEAIDSGQIYYEGVEDKGKAPVEAEGKAEASEKPADTKEKEE